MLKHTHYCTTINFLDRRHRFQYFCPQWKSWFPDTPSEGHTAPQKVRQSESGRSISQYRAEPVMVQDSKLPKVADNADNSKGSACKGPAGSVLAVERRRADGMRRCSCPIKFKLLRHRYRTGYELWLSFSWALLDRGSAKASSTNYKLDSENASLEGWQS
jgi:hypothetical protein